MPALDDRLLAWLNEFASTAGQPEAAREWAAAVNEGILVAVPEVAADPRLRQDLHASTESHWAVFLQVLTDDERVVTVPPAAIRFAQTLAGRGMDVDVLLRVYRVALRAVWDWLTEVVRALDPEGPEPVELLIHFWSKVEWWINTSVSLVVAAYQDERTRVVQSTMAQRIEVVGSILEGRASDVRKLSKTLAHPLSPHQTAGLLWVDSIEDVGHLDRIARRFAEALGSSAPLIVNQGSRDCWFWMASRRKPPLERLGDLVPELEQHSTRAAVGAPAPGIDGFRTSHLEALAAQRLALASRNRPSLVRYDEVELVCLATADPAAADRFVKRVLGKLATDGKGMDRLRETLFAVLCGPGDLDEVATMMSVHKNTLRYRVRRAEEILGHPVADRRADVEVALRLMETMGRL